MDGLIHPADDRGPLGPVIPGFTCVQTELLEGEEKLTRTKRSKVIKRLVEQDFYRYLLFILDPDLKIVPL